MPEVARAGLDTGGSLLTNGAKTVFTNNQQTALYEQTSNAEGATVASASPTVFAENKGVARKTDSMSTGRLISSGSLTVFAG